MAFHLVCEDLFLGLTSMLKELLGDVVTKNIGHELERIRQDFLKDLFLVVAVCSLELLLDESRAMLIATEFNKMVV